MLNLYLDTTSAQIFVELLSDKKSLGCKQLVNPKKDISLTLQIINELCEKANKTIREIEVVYLVIGPGTYTGIRTGTLIAKTWKVANPNLQIYAINSLHFQVDPTVRAISIIDARSGHAYLGEYKDEEVILAPCLINKMTVEYFALSQNANTIVFRDYEKIDFGNQFRVHHAHFQLVNNIEKLKPFYLKPPVFQHPQK